MEKNQIGSSIPPEFRLSVSKTKCFNQCKKQYEYSYILKLPQKDRDYHIFGKFCHKVLEDFHLALLENKEQPYHTLMAYCFNKAKIEFKDGMTPQMTADCFIIINQYLKIISEQKKNNCEPNVIACEKVFKINIGNNVILNGMSDRIDIDPDGVLRVIDYKSTKNKKYLEDDWFQLLTYAYVMYTEDPSIKKVRGSYVLLRHDFEEITKEFDIEEILEVKDMFSTYAKNMINEKEFAPNPTFLCHYCSFEEICPNALSKKKIKSGAIDW